MEGDGKEVNQAGAASSPPRSRGKNKPTPRKQGADRRIKVKTQNFDKNLQRKAEGEEIKKTYRVSPSLC